MSTLPHPPQLTYSPSLFSRTTTISTGAPDESGDCVQISTTGALLLLPTRQGSRFCTKNLLPYVEKQTGALRTEPRAQVYARFRTKIARFRGRIGFCKYTIACALTYSILTKIVGRISRTKPRALAHTAALFAATLVSLLAPRGADRPRASLSARVCTCAWQTRCRGCPCSRWPTCAAARAART